MSDLDVEMTDSDHLNNQSDSNHWGSQSETVPNHVTNMPERRFGTDLPAPDINIGRPTDGNGAVGYQRMNTEEREEDNALSQARIRTVVSARTPSKD